MPESDRLQALTERERRYLRLVLAHRTSKEIAREEGLSKHTVDLHIHRAVRKLGARSRREAALIAAGDTPPIESEYDPPSLEVDGVLGKSPFQHAGRPMTHNRKTFRATAGSGVSAPGGGSA